MISGHDRLIAFWLHQDNQHRGENNLGIEFKFDRKFRNTGNFYIETAEKARPGPGDYVRSGIWRTDNTWQWVQGDDRGVCVFLKCVLQRESQNGHREHRSPTSKGFLLPLARAREIALAIVQIDESGPVLRRRPS